VPDRNESKPTTARDDDRREPFAAAR